MSTSVYTDRWTDYSYGTVLGSRITLSFKSAAMVIYCGSASSLDATSYVGTSHQSFLSAPLLDNQWSVQQAIVYIALLIDTVGKSKWSTGW